MYETETNSQVSNLAHSSDNAEKKNNHNFRASVWNGVFKTASLGLRPGKEIYISLQIYTSHKISTSAQLKILSLSRDPIAEGESGGHSAIQFSYF